jgi:hypothetical protein
MPKLKRTYNMDAFILEALKLVTRAQTDGKNEQAEAPRLEKKDVQTSKDVVLRVIDSLKKA